MDKSRIGRSLSDVIMILLRKKFENFECIEKFEEVMGNCNFTTKEGIDYSCYMKEEKDKREYVLYNKYFERSSRLSLKTMSSKYFDSNIIPDIFQDYILKKEILYKAFKEGMKAFKERKNYYDIMTVLNDEKYVQYAKDNNLNELVYYLWNKGYEFATIFPDPNIVYNQYEYLRKKALEEVNIDKIKEFMVRNRDIHIYLDERPVEEKAKELENVKEIEYSYGHIVAKAKTYDLKMNILPLDGEILVFDTEGINEVAKCNVGYYPIEYQNKALSKMAKSVRSFELENSIENEKNDKKEKEENEQEE